ncbi:MAG: hypothetical protein MZV65_31750 [Chromatiales bacterium]|nr:hypothetical protein [Chromatiales bacterium]
MYIANNGTSTRLVTAPSGLYLWGAQLEAGGSPSSYIKTEAATTTRAASSAAISSGPFSDFYSATGTLMAKYATGGWKHINSPSITSLDLTNDTVTAAQINNRVSRVVLFPRELSTATTDQIKEAW